MFHNEYNNKQKNKIYAEPILEIENTINEIIHLNENQVKERSVNERW